MKREVKDIRELEIYLKETVYAAKIKEQADDQTFFDGSFVDKLAKEDRELYKPSTGARMVLRPASFLVTANPIVYRYPRKPAGAESAAKVAEMLNSFVRFFKRQTVNPFSQHPKTTISFGESYYKVMPNPGGEVPCRVIVPNPMVVFPYGQEVDGVAPEVIMSYETSAANVRKYFPDFAPKKDPVKYMEYWSNEMRYFEADEEELKMPSDTNYWGVVPFIHSLSGWGPMSPESKPEDMAVSAFRYIKDLLRDEAETRSDLKSGIHRHVFPPLLFQEKEVSVEGISGAGIEPPKVNLGSYKGTIIPANLEWLPPPNFMPPKEAFQHYYNIKAEINEIMSPIFEGGVVGSSGRQTDLTHSNALMPYSTIFNGSEAATTTALSMVLKLIDKLDMYPVTVRGTTGDDGTRKDITVTKKDIDGYYDCVVEFKPDDPIERDRENMLNLQFFDRELLDAKSCIMGLGKTEAEATDILTRVAVDSITRTEEYKRLIAIKVAKAEGTLPEMMEALMMSQQTGQTQLPKPRKSEVETPKGREMADSFSLTQRGIRDRQEGK